MNPAGPDLSTDPAALHTLRAELARARQARQAIAPVLAHLVGDASPALFSEEVIARTRGAVESLAFQLLRRCADEPRREALAQLAAELSGQSPLLAHCHALALEASLANRLAAQGIDPVLSPLLQGMIASPEPDLAALAMTVLAAQARFVQAQRRMETALEELPADLLHDVLPAFERHGGDGVGAVALLIRDSFDEGRTRTALVARLLLSGEGGFAAALDPDQAGIALFFSALSLATGLPRDAIVLTATEGQHSRLALMLGACGVVPAAREATLARLLPDGTRPSPAATLSPEAARALLAEEAGQ